MDLAYGTLTVFTFLFLIEVALAEPAPSTVKPVDLQRDIGSWHEIAYRPNWVQRDCVGDTTATVCASWVTIRQML